MAISDQIHTYTEADQGGTASDLLNLATQTVKDAVDDVEAALTGLSTNLADAARLLAAATSAAEPYALVRRDGSNSVGVGKLLIVDAQSPDARAATRKDYVDSQVAGAVAGAGTTAAEPASIARRDANGALTATQHVITAAEPTSDQHATPRLWVARRSYRTKVAFTNVGGGVGAGTTVTLPAGQFGGPPGFSATPEAPTSANVTAWVLNPSAASVDVVLRNNAGANLPTAYVHLIAFA